MGQPPIEMSACQTSFGDVVVLVFQEIEKKACPPEIAQEITCGLAKQVADLTSNRQKRQITFFILEPAPSETQDG
ncbi:hypothetical protein N825_00735 [Skermanella stibiiresistens SB22]|uniref:Uncharacterized protein n=1 Tax=Skermanella stibiiresistens SB22 TaxID=1385369 RepID=W9HFX5_9PROT|nr:hypothetical protein N825_00735 [Skermanella stibiiresistens SB22]